MHAPLQMTVSGEGRIDMSFEGANKWDYHSFNCAPSPMQGAMWVQLTQTLWNSDKINDGAYYATGLKLPYMMRYTRLWFTGAVPAARSCLFRSAVIRRYP